MNEEPNATAPGQSAWTDPGYFSGKSPVRNTGRILWQLIRPPKGHRTLPTKVGVLFIFITLGIGTAAFNTGQNILYIVLAFLLSTLLLSGILSWLNFKGCRWRLESAERLRVGELNTVRLLLSNTKRWLPTYVLQFQLVARLSGQSGEVALDDRLDPGGKVRLSWSFRPRQRGLETIELRGMLSRYPFGFLRKTILESNRVDSLVWPARCELVWHTPAAGEAHRQGSDISRAGEGNDLRNLREYRPGDALKQISWKASAKINQLVVRETEDENRQAYCLEVDPSPALWSEDKNFEHMLSIAGTLSEDLFRQDRLAAWRIRGQPPRRLHRIEDWETMMDELAEMEPHNPGIDAGGPVAWPVLRFRPAADHRIHCLLEQEVFCEG